LESSHNMGYPVAVKFQTGDVVTRHPREPSFR
jgi:hypothetical protein